MRQASRPCSQLTCCFPICRRQWGQAPFYLHKLVHDTWLPNACAVEVDGAPNRVEGRASAQISDDRKRIVVRYVNQSPVAEMLTLDITGFAVASSCQLWAYQSDDLAIVNTPSEPQALVPSVSTVPSSSLANLTVKMRSIVTVVCNSGDINTPHMPHKSDDDASASTAPPQQHCATCRRPQWSWETVGHMAFTHTCNVSGPWSEDALDVLQRFPIVNIERYMSQHQHCFARHRSQWAGPSTCWLNVSHGNPACSTWTGPGGPGSNGPPWSWQDAGLAGCSCPVEEAPAGLTPSATDLYVEDHLISACKQLKERNANLTTIFYHDSCVASTP
eukprot:COSAG06_NODE_3371_length_5438_cov_18.670350_1_plen_330_part_10